MRKIRPFVLALAAFLSAGPVLAQSRNLEPIPAHRDSDVRVFFSNGKNLSGIAALKQMQ